MTRKYPQQFTLVANAGRNILLSAFCCLLGLFVTVAYGAKFTASLDRDTLVLGETVTLRLDFEGVNPGGMPQLPQIPGLQIAGGLSSGSNSSIGPDGNRVSYWYAVPLAALQPGEYTIPSFQIELEGQKHSSAPLRLKVLREDPTAPPVEFENKSAFLWLTLKPECYVGEILLAELRLYIRPGVRNISGFQMQPFQGDGFTSAKQWTQGNNIQRRVGRKTFTVIPMYCTLTAIKTGPLTITPLNASVVLNPPDVFDGFFGRRNDSEQVALTTPQTEIRALPLPKENMPPNFNGAVGNYTLNLTAGPTNVATGDPITVRVQIAGRGALEALSLPEQPEWKYFKSYPPNVNLETSDHLGLQGTKTFEQIITPQSTEIHELPAFNFSFFDPEAKSYRTLTHPAIPLTIRPGGAAPNPVVAAALKPSNQDAATSQDIVHIKPRPGTLVQLRPPWVYRPWFLALPSTPILAFLAAFVWRKRKESLANNPRLRRQRHVAQIIRAGLEELRQHAAEKNSDKFFSMLVHLLQEQIGDRLDCPASSITEAVVDEKLKQRGLSDRTVTELHDLFQAANLARYAPVRSEQELAAFVPRLENALFDLREIKA